jgi:hypothetical protein
MEFTMRFPRAGFEYMPGTMIAKDCALNLPKVGDDFPVRFDTDWLFGVVTRIDGDMVTVVVKGPRAQKLLRERVTQLVYPSMQIGGFRDAGDHQEVIIASIIHGVAMPQRDKKDYGCN